MVTEKPQQKMADFGYQKVSSAEKEQLVKQVFDNVADQYDLMNDLMSLSLHRLWKRFTLIVSKVHQGDHVLDLAGGSGDLTMKLAREVGKEGTVTLADINFPMLNHGRNRLIDKGLIQNVKYVQANAQDLPFPANYFDCITIAFGLRNVTDKDEALRSMYRVLKPGGKLLILEFSQPTHQLMRPLYDAYSFTVLPFIGKIVTGHPESYHYLVESIRRHPDQDTLKLMIEQAGFEDCVYHNLSGGVVALHKAYKY